MKNKWRPFFNKNYVLKNLGRPAIFLLPVKHLKKKVGKTTVEKDLHQFLIEHFGSYTTSVIPNFGLWKNTQKATISDKCREYEVSFLGKKRIPLLLKKLAEIAAITQEECIYVKAGQYSCLVYPVRSPNKV